MVPEKPHRSSLSTFRFVSSPISAGSPGFRFRLANVLSPRKPRFGLSDTSNNCRFSR